MPRHCALGGLPAVFLIEQRNQFTNGAARMAPENGLYHVESCEPAVSAFRRASGLHFAAANLSAAPELLLRPR